MVRSSLVGTVPRERNPGKADHRPPRGRTAHPYSVGDHEPAARLFAAEGIALGLLMPFLVPILVDRGLGAAEIGLALSASGLASLLAYPVWGAIADSRLGRRRTIAVASAAAAGGDVLLLFAGSDPLLITLAISVVLVGALPWGPLIDAVTLQELAEASAGYGRVRAWASVGWAVVAITAGAVWLVVGPEPIFVVFSVAALEVAALVLLPGARAGGATGAASTVWFVLRGPRFAPGASGAQVAREAEDLSLPPAPA